MKAKSITLNIASLIDNISIHQDEKRRIKKLKVDANFNSQKASTLSKKNISVTLNFDSLVQTIEIVVPVFEKNTDSGLSPEYLERVSNQLQGCIQQAVLSTLCNVLKEV